MKAVIGALTALAGIFAILNNLGGLVSGIWLAFLSEWRVIAIGVLGALVSHFALAIVLLPCAAIGAAGLAAAKRGSRFGYLGASALANLCVAAAMTAWSLWIMSFFLSRATERTWIPMLVWSYGVALGPWGWMAQKEAQGGGGDASLNVVVFARLAYVASMLLVAFVRPEFSTVFATFVGIMAVGQIVQFFSGLANTSGSQFEDSEPA